MIRTGLTALVSHWRRNPWQLFTLFAGLAMATALWSGVQAINSEARASYDRAAQTIGQGFTTQIVRKDGNPIELSQYVQLRRAGWNASPVAEGELRVGKVVFRMLGVDPISMAQGNSGVSAFGLSELIGGSPIQGFLVAHPDDVAALADLGLKPIPDDTQIRGRITTDFANLERLLQAEAQITRLLVSERQPLLRTELKELDSTLVEQHLQNPSDIARLTESFHLNLTAFALLSFAVGIFIVYGAIGLAFEQRRPVFRILRAVGLPLTHLTVLLILELTIFAFLAGGAGVALGYVIAGFLLPDVAATLRGLYGAEVSGQLSLQTGWWLSGLGMALLGTGVAAIHAIWRLHRLPLLTSAQPRAWAENAVKSSRRLGVIAVILAVSACVLAVFGSGLLAGFALLACLLMGAAMALPLIMDRVLWYFSRNVSGVVTGWFWADTRQQLPGLSMALMALMLAMAANVGVSTMVSSFRLTFIGFLDQRLASDLYVTAANAEQSEELREYLEPQAEAILPFVSLKINLGGLPAEIRGIKDHATYRDNWVFLTSTAQVWDKLARGDGVLINEQMSRRNGIGVGDVAPTGHGDVILGVFGDYGNPSGQIVMGIDQFWQRFPDVAMLRFGVRAGQDRDADELAARLVREFGLPDGSVVHQARLKAMSLEVFERTFSVTSALNFMTLAVAGVAILISLLTLATMRLPQLAPVWALGLTRRHIAGLELIRAVFLAGVIGTLAVPLGLALAWVLLAIVNVQAFGWRLPMYLFPLDYIRLGLLTLIAAFLAALWPAMRLWRTPPGELLKVFSNER